MGKCESTLGGDQPISCVAFLPDGKILGVDDGTRVPLGRIMERTTYEVVRLYDPVTGDVKSTLIGHPAL